MEKKCPSIFKGLWQVIIAGFGRILEMNRDLICSEGTYYCPNFLEQILRLYLKTQSIF